jgi:hypothetical protein
MRMLGAVSAVLLASLIYTYGLAAQPGSGGQIALEFCDFVPYEYTFHLPGQGGTLRQTVGYRIVEQDGTRLLERRFVQELVEPMAIPRGTQRRIHVSLAALPDLRPYSARIVILEWKESDKEGEKVSAWSTVKIEASFSGDSVRRTVKSSDRATDGRVRPLPAGVRLAEMMSAVVGYAAGARPPARMRIPIYDVENDRVTENGWELEGNTAENVTALGEVHRAWPVRTGADTVGYYRVQRPRIFLGADRIVKGEKVRYYRLTRLWLADQPSAAPCKTGSDEPPPMVKLPRFDMTGRGRP